MGTQQRLERRYAAEGNRKRTASDTTALDGSRANVTCGALLRGEDCKPMIGAVDLKLYWGHAPGADSRGDAKAIGGAKATDADR